MQPCGWIDNECRCALEGCQRSTRCAWSVTVLGKEDFKTLERALAKPPKANAALKALMRRERTSN